MDLLLDTHVFLWWDAGGERLKRATSEAIAAPRNRVFVSAASVWEIAIKRRLGKLRFAGRAAEAIGRNGFTELPVSAFEAEEAGGLDWAHADPFDRLLVAQAQVKQLTLVTADPVVRGYGGVAAMEG